jgi:class 3 adenylate cyclase
MEYTVLGDAVNIASRLENCLKERMDDAVAQDRCRILMSESTYQRCGDLFRTYDLGDVDLRKPTPVHVYAVLGLTSAVNGVSYSSTPVSVSTSERSHEAV